MGKLMQDDVLAIRRIGRTGLHGIPCKHHCSQPTTRLTQAGHFPLLPHMTVNVPSLLRYICRWVNENGEQTREVIGVAMQEEKASLRSNSDPYLICDLQTIATFKTLLGQKNLDVTE